MHLHTHLVAVGHYGDIARNYGRYSRRKCCIDYIMYQRNVLTVHHGVQGQVTLYPVRITLTGYFAQVIEREMAGAAGAHIELFHAKVD